MPGEYPIKAIPPIAIYSGAVATIAAITPVSAISPADPNASATPGGRGTVREESMVGLGKRKDQRGLPALIAELNQPEISDRLIEAAEAFLTDNVQRADRSPGDYVAALKKHFPL
jgi:hypothetical protein